MNPAVPLLKVCSSPQEKPTFFTVNNGNFDGNCNGVLRPRGVHRIGDATRRKAVVENLRPSPPDAFHNALRRGCGVVLQYYLHRLPIVGTIANQRRNAGIRCAGGDLGGDEGAENLRRNYLQYIAL